MKSHLNLSFTALPYLNNSAPFVSHLYCTLCVTLGCFTACCTITSVFKHTEGKNSLACFGCLTINTSASGTKERMRKWVFCFYKLCLSSSSLWSILLHKWIGWGHYRTSRDNNVLLDWISTEVTTPKATFLMIVLLFSNSFGIFILPSWIEKMQALWYLLLFISYQQCWGFFALIWSSICNVVNVLSAKTGKTMQFMIAGSESYLWGCFLITW